MIMSVYNGEKYLREAIESVLAQTFTDFEFIIVNDGSTDNSLKIIQSYRDERIKIINNEKIIGLTKSLNKAIKQAKGEYIARQDADDISMPNRLKEQVKILDRLFCVGVVCSWVLFIDRASKEIVLRKVLQWEKTKKIFKYENLIVHGAVMFRKYCFEKVGGYTESQYYGQDRDLWGKMIQNHVGFYIIQKPLYKYRISTENLGVKEKGDKKKSCETKYKFWLVSLYLQENKPKEAVKLLLPLLKQYPLSFKALSYYLISFFPNKPRRFIMWKLRLFIRKIIEEVIL